MEELNLDYELKVYLRTEGYTAPSELMKIWPTGMSPVLQIFKKDRPEPITLAESGHIVSYVIDHYDTEGKLVPETEEGKELVDYYLHFTEGSLQPHLVSILVGHFACQQSPWGVLFIVKQIVSRMNLEYYYKRLMTNLRFLDNRLKEKGGGYFVENKLTGADILLDFPLNENLFADPQKIKNMGFGEDMAAEFPHIAEWHRLTTNEPLRKKAVEIEKAKL